VPRQSARRVRHRQTRKRSLRLTRQSPNCPSQGRRFYLRSGCPGKSPRLGLSLSLLWIGSFYCAKKRLLYSQNIPRRLPPRGM
jgi:hypothetical protein